MNSQLKKLTSFHIEFQPDNGVSKKVDHFIENTLTELNLLILQV